MTSCFTIQTDYRKKDPRKGGDELMVLSTRAWVAMAAIAAAAVMMIQTVFAAPPAGDTRPGWGGTNPKSQGKSVGDQNHVHTGPPGQTVAPPSS